MPGPAGPGYPALMRRLPALILCLVVPVLGACSGSSNSGRAVVGLDRAGRPMYADASQQAAIDRQKKMTELLNKVAKGEKKPADLTVEERALLAAALEASKK